MHKIVKKHLPLIVLIFIQACGPGETNEFNLTKVDSIISSEKNYFKYYATALKFNDSSIYLNEADSIVSNKYFFQKMYEGFSFPLRSDNNNIFKLVKIKQWPDIQVNGLIKGVGLQQLNKVNLIGKRLMTTPVYDLTGQQFDTLDLKNKLVFAKFWFIKCGPCVAEMPELNDIFEKYKERKDIIFLSFAFDKKQELQAFLKQTKFLYHVIATDKDFVFNTMGIESFPTGLFIYNNRVIKVLKNSSEIISIINNPESAK